MFGYLPALVAITTDEAIQFLLDLVRTHWPKLASAVVLTGGGWWLGRWREQIRWRRREFLGRINISLNSIQDGKLMIRTVIEKGLEEVFLNRHAVEIVQAAAERTTEQNPLLPLPKDDTWFILNAVLNDVAEKFSMGEVRRDMGMPVTMHRYVICLTRERAGGVRIQKVRAMLIRKDLLLNLPDEMPQLESHHHATRFHTLKTIAAIFPKQPDQFLEMDISI
jgi:hypothetical protein